MRVNGRRVCVLLIGGLVSGLLMSLVRDDEIIRPLQGQDFSVTGQWSAPQPWPVTAVHDHMLPTGKVLFYGYSDEAWLWDPQTDGLTPAAHVGYNIFCTGHSWMADGRLFFTQMVLGYTACVSLSVVLFGSVAPMLVGLLIPPEYAGAGPIVGLAMVAPLFFGFYYLFSIQAILRAGATIWLTILPAGGVGLNLLLSLWLVRLWGMPGVILGSALSAVALALVTLHVSLTLEPMPFPQRTVQAMAMLTVVTAAVLAIADALATPARYAIITINILASAACLMAVTYRAMGGRDAPRA